MFKYYVTIFFLICYHSSKAISFQQQVERLSYLPAQDFIDEFPYQEYIDDKVLYNIEQLELYKQIINKAGFNGDFFLMKLFENYLATHPIQSSDLIEIKNRIRIGEMMNYSTTYLDNDIIIYSAIGMLMFTNVSDSLESWIDKEIIEPDVYNFKYIIERLGENKYFINVPVSPWTKLFNYAREGRWSYIGRKITTTYKNYLLVAIVIGVIVIYLSFKFYSSIRRKPKLENTTK